MTFLFKISTDFQRDIFWTIFLSIGICLLLVVVQKVDKLLDYA